MFKQRKHKTFNYQSRFSGDNQAKSNDVPTSETPDFVSKWNSQRTQNRKIKAVMPLRTLIIILVLLLICMYLLDTKFNM
ncbi:MAG: hypothetical protein ACK5NB_10015 [Flavobacteriaceae bacterium]